MRALFDPTNTKWRLACLSVPLVCLTLLSGCGAEDEAEIYEVRPVRTVTVDKREAGEPVTLIGRIEAEDEVSLAFRISGRLIENNGKRGDRVEAGQVVARLEPQNEMNGLRAAQAESRRSARPADPGAQSFRSSGHAAQGWLDDACEPRSGAPGAADGAGAGRCCRGAAADGA